MGKLFSTPKAPQIKPAAPMPDEAEVKRTARRKASKSAKTSGAESTLLSTGGRETLGA